MGEEVRGYHYYLRGAYYQNERTRSEVRYSTINRRPGGGNTQQHTQSTMHWTYSINNALMLQHDIGATSPSSPIYSNLPTLYYLYQRPARPASILPLPLYLSSPPTPPLSNQILREYILRAVNYRCVAIVDAININLAISLLHISLPLSFLQNRSHLPAKLHLPQSVV